MQTVMSHTLLDVDRLRALIRFAKRLNADGIPGDFMECGAYKGGTAALLSKFLPAHRHLWIYDSFQGLPEATEIDGENACQLAGECAASADDVRAIMRAVSAEPACFTIREGWFKDTYSNEEPEQIALLHCDADWYDSVLLTLKTFYDRVADGGCVILDDFGYWEGCREAFYDFCAAQGIKPLLRTVGDTQAYWIKGQTCAR